MTPNFTILTKEEKLRNELRQELFQTKAALEAKTAECEAKDETIKKFESFIDLINSRVNVNSGNGMEGNGPGPSFKQ